MFISYRRLSYFILSCFFVLMIASFYQSVLMLEEGKNPTKFTMSSIVSTYKSISIDTNGNGKKDIIDISIDDERKEYKIDIINDDNKRYTLSQAPQSDVLGPYVPWWPLKVMVADINMDNMPEIIMQLSKSNNSSLSYIFRWNGQQYSNVLSGSWNGIYLIDVNGDNIPEVVTEEKVSGMGDLYSVYAWAVKSYSKVSIRLDSVQRGYDKIKQLINMMNTPFEDKISDISVLSTFFTNEWLENPKNIQSLGIFAKDIIGIQLQDYIGEEITSSGKIDPGLVQWKLRYIVFRKYGSEIKVENYTAEIETTSSGGTYKIKSIKFKGQ